MLQERQLHLSNSIEHIVYNDEWLSIVDKSVSTTGYVSPVILICPIKICGNNKRRDVGFLKTDIYR